MYRLPNFLNFHNFHKSLISIALWLFFIPQLYANWDGFPVDTNTTWYLLQDYHLIEQLWEAARERTLAIDGVVIDCVDTWTVEDCVVTHVFPTITNDAGDIFPGPFTNVDYYTTNITTTNVFGEFSYINSLGEVKTGRTFVSINMVSAIDNMINNLFGSTSIFGHHFLANSIWDFDGTTSWKQWFNTDHGSWTNTEPHTYPLYPSFIPFESRGNLFYQLGIGAQLSGDLPATNAWGYVTNAVYYYYQPGYYWFTKSPIQPTWNKLLAETSWTTNSVSGDNWDNNVNISNFIKDNVETNYYPIIQYHIAGINPFGGPITVNLTGLSTTNTAITEAIQLTSTNAFGLTKQWSRVDGITLSRDGYNYGDTISIAYTNPVILYQTQDYPIPYRLYAVDLNERYRVLNSLKSTYISYVKTTLKPYDEPGWWGYGSADNSGDAIANQSSDWANDMYAWGTGDSYKYARFSYNDWEGERDPSYSVSAQSWINREKIIYDIPTNIAHEAELFCWLNAINDGFYEGWDGWKYYYNLTVFGGTIEDDVDMRKFHCFKTFGAGQLDEEIFDMDSAFNEGDNPATEGDFGQTRTDHYWWFYPGNIYMGTGPDTSIGWFGVLTWDFEYDDEGE